MDNRTNELLEEQNELLRRQIELQEADKPNRRLDRGVAYTPRFAALSRSGGRNG